MSAIGRLQTSRSPTKPTETGRPPLIHEQQRRRLQQPLEFLHEQRRFIAVHDVVVEAGLVLLVL